MEHLQHLKVTTCGLCDVGNQDLTTRRTSGQLHIQMISFPENSQYLLNRRVGGPFKIVSIVQEIKHVRSTGEEL